MQDIWLQKLEWDAPFSDDFHQRWLLFSSSLCDLEKIDIPRYTGIQTEHRWHFHGFCDAPKRAYVAAVYSVSL